jgi:hypothetical protein
MKGQARKYRLYRQRISHIADRVFLTLEDGYDGMDHIQVFVLISNQKKEELTKLALPYTLINAVELECDTKEAIKLYKFVTM